MIKHDLFKVQSGYELKLKPSNSTSEVEEFILNPLARRDSYYLGSVQKLATSMLVGDSSETGNVHGNLETGNAHQVRTGFRTDTSIFINV